MTGRSIAEEGPVSFLSRLGGERPAREPYGDERFACEVAAVARNLGAIFNTKRGCGSVVSSFGLGEYEGQVGTKGILAVLIPELEHAVRCFEPRLADPAVEATGRDGKLHAVFALRAMLSGRPVKFRLALHTAFRDMSVEAVPRPPSDA